MTAVADKKNNTKPVLIDGDLQRLLKAEAAKQGISMKELVERPLRKLVALSEHEGELSL